MSSNTQKANKWYTRTETGEHRLVSDLPSLIGDMTGHDVIEADPDGWVNWTGGKRPVGKYDRVDIIMSDGIEVHGLVGHTLDWEHQETPRDFPVAYRPARTVTETGWNRMDVHRPPDHRQVLFVAIGVGPRCDYITDVYCGWIQNGGFARWPHEFQPTHWMNIPKLPEKL